MSDTPETDKQAMQMPMKADAQSPSGWCSVVRTSFARQQEEKISALQDDNAALRENWRITVDLIDAELNRGTDESRPLTNRLTAFGNIATIIHSRARAALGRECPYCTNGIIRSLGRDNDEIIEDCPKCSALPKEVKP